MPSYLIFGDLHGRVLPAFALARAWQRDHREPLAGLLQVGDLGYFPDHDRLDRATKRHAQRDSLELGAREVIFPNQQTKDLFAQPDVPGPMWFIAGNHEDHELLANRYGDEGSSDDDFPADQSKRLRCILSGHVAEVSGGLRVGGLWGIDNEAPKCRRNVSEMMAIEPKCAKRLAMRQMDVFLTHDSPRDAMEYDCGSEHISFILGVAKPAFAFFGHYHGEGRLDECDFGRTQVFHLSGLEFRGRGHCAEERCVGVLRWEAGEGSFEYAEEKWLRKFARHNWMSF